MGHTLTPSPVPGAPAGGRGRRVTLWDVAVTVGLLAGAVTVCWPASLELSQRAAASQRELERCVAEVHDLQSLVESQQARYQDFLRLRGAAERTAASVDRLGSTPWTTALSEISRNRPAGVWAESIQAYGPNFKLRVHAERPELMLEYAQRLGMSPFIRHIAPPSIVDGTVAGLHGSFAGE